MYYTPLNKHIPRFCIYIKIRYFQNMLIKSKDYELDIQDITSEQNDWISIKSQSFIFDKRDFFIESFNRSFPDSKLLGSDSTEKFNFVSSLCSRNNSLKRWYTLTSIQFSEMTQLPLYLKDSVSPSDFKKISDKLNLLKKKTSSFVQERTDLAAKYSKDLKDIEEREKCIVKKTLGDDNIMKILSLNTEALPLSIQMKIQTYGNESSDLDMADSRRQYAQEYLAKFKVALIKLSTENKNFSVDDFIEEIQLK